MASVYHPIELPVPATKLEKVLKQVHRSLVSATGISCTMSRRLSQSFVNAAPYEQRQIVNGPKNVVAASYTRSLL